MSSQRSDEAKYEKMQQVTDEKDDEEHDVDDELSQSRLDLDVTLVSVFSQSCSPQSYNRRTVH